MTAYPLSHILGSEAFNIDALRTLHIRQSIAFLDRAKTPHERQALAAASGIPETDILAFANAADLMRVKGIGPDHVALLRAVGVRTVRDLRCRNGAKLFRAMAIENVKSEVVRFLPAESFVLKWIEQAKQLPLVIRYR